MKCINLRPNPTKNTLMDNKDTASCVLFFPLSLFVVVFLYLNGACSAMFYFIRPLAATPSKHTQTHLTEKTLQKKITTNIKQCKLHATC